MADLPLLHLPLLNPCFFTQRMLPPRLIWETAKIPCQHRYLETQLKVGDAENNLMWFRDVK